MGKLDGKVAIITGASSGIGAAVAHLFYDEGATLALFDVGPPADELAGRGRVSAHQVDVTDAGEVEAAMDEVAAEHGAIDVLVNAAGILEQESFLEMNPHQWYRSMGVVMRGVFMYARYASATMVVARVWHT